MLDRPHDRDDAGDRDTLDGGHKVSPEPDGEEVVPLRHLPDEAGRRLLGGDVVLAEGVHGRKSKEIPDGNV